MPNYASGAKKKKVKEVAPGSDKKTKDFGSKKKLVAVSASDVTADGPEATKKSTKKSAKQVLAEYQASEAERRRLEREAREAIVAKAAERRREAGESRWWKSRALRSLTRTGFTEFAEAKRRAQTQKTVEQVLVSAACLLSMLLVWLKQHGFGVDIRDS